jgi:hypothetical protein
MPVMCAQLRPTTGMLIGNGESNHWWIEIALKSSLASKNAYLATGPVNNCLRETWDNGFLPNNTWYSYIQWVEAYRLELAKRYSPEEGVIKS